MSFSPSPAGSPPSSNAALPNPRKRPSLGPGSSAKRRKASTYSIASINHPLRQTSFPPDEGAALSGVRSPSAETDIAPSVATSVTGGKRLKKLKSTAPEGSVRSVKAGASAKRAESEADADGEDGDEEDEEEDEGNAEMLDGSSRNLNEHKQRFATLFEAADPDQEDRLSSHRQFHLQDAKLRKIVNQTLSQSVPKTVIQAVSAYSKLFIGELIEKAIEIQRQNALAGKSYPTPDPPAKTTPDQQGQKEGDESAVTDDEDEKAVKEEPIGPLLPDNLREALRRMKRDGEYGGAGFEGSSVGVGMQGARSAALGGRRLFC